MRSYWEFAAVSQFLHLFHEAFGLAEFDTDELESQLLSPPPEARLVELHIKMLRTLTGSRLISVENWQSYMLKEIERRNPEENPMMEGVDYFDLPPRNKVLILHYLCEWQFDNPDKLRASMPTEEEQIYWRVEPVGYDAKGNTYWLFDDNRLYRESPPAAPVKAKSKKRKSITKPEPAWVLECLTLEDWISFAAKFSKSRNAAEKEFHEFLVQNALPKVQLDLQEKDKTKKLQEALMNRKRSSRLQMRELEKLEMDRQDELRRIQEEEERRHQQQEERRLRDEMEKQRRIEGRERRIAEREARLAEKRLGQEMIARDRETRLEQRKSGGSQSQSERSTRKRNRRNEEEEEEHWYFDCVCGVHGENLDDGTPMIACEKCGVWQHIMCLARAQGQEEGSVRIEEWQAVDFVCNRCKRREMDAANSAAAVHHDGDQVEMYEEGGQLFVKRVRLSEDGGGSGGYSQPFPPTGISMSSFAAATPDRPAPNSVVATPLAFPMNGLTNGGVTPTNPNLASFRTPQQQQQQQQPQLPPMTIPTLPPQFAMAIPHPASPAYYQPSILTYTTGVSSAPISNVDDDYGFPAPGVNGSTSGIAMTPNKNGGVGSGVGADQSANAAAYFADLASTPRNGGSGGAGGSGGGTGVVTFPSPVSVVPGRSGGGGGGQAVPKEMLFQAEVDGGGAFGGQRSPMQPPPLPQHLQQQQQPQQQPLLQNRAGLLNGNGIDHGTTVQDLVNAVHGGYNG
ncbi:hypothetical protein HK097_008997 [Rhizophlyctis rosea]|uniref:DDT domain-containing protein n=1 Tax=Rhizophlyctis rosea TaxID=64517 RepID=A0AAD5SBQ1_9FUNG|nr:hypothetical protein HK097_008997 [Rhizophlyctis rosea]